MKSTQTYPKPQFKRFQTVFIMSNNLTVERNRTKNLRTNHNHKDITDIVQEPWIPYVRLTQGNNVELETLPFRSPRKGSCRKKPQSTRNRCSYTPSRRG